MLSSEEMYNRSEYSEEHKTQQYNSHRQQQHQQHQQRYQGKQRFYCQFCSGKKFYTEDYLEDHMRRRHMNHIQYLEKKNAKKERKQNQNTGELLDTKLNEMKAYFETLIRSTQMKNDFNLLSQKINSLENSLNMRHTVMPAQSYGVSMNMSQQYPMAQSAVVQGGIPVELKEKLNQLNEEFEKNKSNNNNQMEALTNEVRKFKKRIEDDFNNLKQSTSNVRTEHHLKHGTTTITYEHVDDKQEDEQMKLQAKFKKVKNDELKRTNKGELRYSVQKNKTPPKDNNNNNVVVNSSNNNNLASSSIKESTIVNPQIEQSNIKQSMISQNTVQQQLLQQGQQQQPQHKQLQQSKQFKNPREAIRYELTTFYDAFTGRDNNFEEDTNAYNQRVMPQEKYLPERTTFSKLNKLKQDKLNAYTLNELGDIKYDNLQNQPQSVLNTLIQKIYLKMNNDGTNENEVYYNKCLNTTMNIDHLVKTSEYDYEEMQKEQQQQQLKHTIKLNQSLMKSNLSKNSGSYYNNNNNASGIQSKKASKFQSSNIYAFDNNNNNSNNKVNNENDKTASNLEFDDNEFDR